MLLGELAKYTWSSHADACAAATAADRMARVSRGSLHRVPRCYRPLNAHSCCCYPAYDCRFCCPIASIAQIAGMMNNAVTSADCSQMKQRPATRASMFSATLRAKRRVCATDTSASHALADEPRNLKPCLTKRSKVEQKHNESRTMWSVQPCIL
eukprot:SAG31_NODE_4773_length_2966_cov_1.618068_3_plen_154_part_00